MSVRRIYADPSANPHEIRRAIQILNKELQYLFDLVDQRFKAFVSQDDSIFDLGVEYIQNKTRVVVNNLEFYRKDDDTESLGIWDYEEIQNSDGTYTKIQTRRPVPYGSGVIVFYSPQY